MVGGTAKASRMVGGRTLTYRPSAPVAGSFRSRMTIKKALENISEKKANDLSAASYNVDTTGSITLMNGVAAGTDFFNRVGRTWRVKSIQVRGVIGPTSGTDNATGCLAKVAVIYDAQPNGALPAMTDIFTASSSVSFMNLNNRDRFKVLASHEVALGPFDNTASVALADSTISKVEIFKNVDLPVINSGTGATISSLQTGSILLVVIGSNGFLTGYTFFGTTRIRFVDN